MKRPRVRSRPDPLDGGPAQLALNRHGTPIPLELDRDDGTRLFERLLMGDAKAGQRHIGNEKLPARRMPAHDLQNGHAMKAPSLVRHGPILEGRSWPSRRSGREKNVSDYFRGGSGGGVERLVRISSANSPGCDSGFTPSRPVLLAWGSVSLRSLSFS
jgi:hypothetical protein